MNNTEMALQANMCGCKGVWFSPYFKTDADPETCPYCKQLISKQEHIDFREQQEESVVPPEIIRMLNHKTSMGMFQKKCSFCSNSIIMAKEDVESCKFCPYCTADLVLIDFKEEEQGMKENNEPEGNFTITILDELIGSVVKVKMNSSDKKMFSFKNIFIKNKNETSYITGVYLGMCPISRMIKIGVIEEKTIKWIKIDDLNSIEECNFEGID